EVRLTADKKFFLVTEEVFHDYEFEGELKLPEGKSNSGFMARGQVKPNKVYGYQAEADPTDRRWSGGLYDESRRQWLHPLWRDSNAQAAFDRDRWNRYRIRCVGNHLQFFVNDVLTTDYFDPADLSGRIGLQHHGEKGQTYRFRNLEVRNLGRHAWQPLMKANASGIASLDGWNTVGGGTWEIVDGILQGRASSEANEPNGLLFSEATYGDFTIRFQYRFVQGDSGFFFRSQILDDKPYVRGVQCEIDGTEDVAGLYQTGGKGWLVRPLHYLDRFPEDRHAVVRNRWRQAKQGTPLEQQDPRSKTDTASDLEPNPWNSMVVSVSGKRIVTHLNGCLASDTVVDDLAESGVIAFQLHGQQDLEVDFRKIEILLPTDP
ncbi:MAG: DUF1080 domain-containing protein, partial [Planctomycetota bacterium]